MINSKHNFYKDYILKRSASLPPKFVGLILAIIILGITSWLLILLFGFWELSVGLTKLDLVFGLKLVLILCGIAVLVTKILEYVFFEISEVAEDKFASETQNQYITLKMQDNDDFDETQKTMVKFFFSQIMFSFRSRNSDSAVNLTAGKFDLKMVFDYIFKDGQKSVYATVAHKRLPNFLMATKNYLPKVNWQIISLDPLTKFQDNHFDGFSVGLKKNNLHRIMLPSESKDISSFLDLCQELSKNGAIIVQYCFVFPAQISKAFYNQEFKKYVADINSRYNFKSKLGFGQTRFKTIASMIPGNEVQRFNDIFARLGRPWFNCSIKITTCSDDKVDNIKLIKQLQTAFESSIGQDKNGIKIEYLTASNQEYFAFDKTSVPVEMSPIYANMNFPDPKIEQFLAPLAQRYYYANENRYRSTIWKKSILKRHPEIPIRSGSILMDIATVESLIQF